MKYLFLIFLFPVAVHSQTVHVDKEMIVYTGSEKINSVENTEIFARVKSSITDYVKNNDMHFSGDSSIITNGIIILSSPYPVIKKLHYRLNFVTGDNSYHYSIDSVYLSEKERGRKTIKTPSKHILKNMEVSGPTAMITENLLNEIDMRIQQLLDMIKNRVNGITSSAVIKKPA